jgi:hypothetical protein
MNPKSSLPKYRFKKRQVKNCETKLTEDVVERRMIFKRRTREQRKKQRKNEGLNKERVEGRRT